MTSVLASSSSAAILGVRRPCAASAWPLARKARKRPARSYLRRREPLRRRDDRARRRELGGAELFPLGQPDHARLGPPGGARGAERREPVVELAGARSTAGSSASEAPSKRLAASSIAVLASATAALSASRPAAASLQRLVERRDFALDLVAPRLQRRDRGLCRGEATERARAGRARAASSAGTATSPSCDAVRRGPGGDLVERRAERERSRRRARSPPDRSRRSSSARRQKP